MLFNMGLKVAQFTARFVETTPPLFTAFSIHQDTKTQWQMSWRTTPMSQRLLRPILAHVAGKNLLAEPVFHGAFMAPLQAILKAAHPPRGLFKRSEFQVFHRLAWGGMNMRTLLMTSYWPELIRFPQGRKILQRARQILGQLKVREALLRADGSDLVLTLR